MKKREAARRQLYLHDGNDVEDVVVVKTWKEDVKTLLLSESDNENTR